MQRRTPEESLRFSAERAFLAAASCGICASGIFRFGSHHGIRSAAKNCSVAGAWGAVNAVSLYVERARETFHSVHVEAAGRIAALAHRAGLARLVQVSGIGAGAQSKSLYIRKRGEGERAVRAAFAEATLIRPAVMFSADDAFLTTILTLLRRLPVYPMFGRGSTKLQPTHADDVAEAIARTLQRVDATQLTFECGGPRVFYYEELLRTIAREAGLKPILVPVPFAIWHVLARVAEMLPTAPVTRNQVELMEVDTVASADLPGFAELGILPRAIEPTLQEIVQADRATQDRSIAHGGAPAGFWSLPPWL